MSHITSLETKISDLEILKKTLDELEIKYCLPVNGEKLTVTDWKKNKTEVDLEIKTGCSYSVGLVYNEQEKNYQFVADWWGVETFTGVKDDEYLNRILQKYSYNSVIDKVRKQGYSVVREERDENNNIRLSLSKWD